MNLQARDAIGGLLVGIGGAAAGAVTWAVYRWLIYLRDNGPTIEFLFWVGFVGMVIFGFSMFFATIALDKI